MKTDEGMDHAAVVTLIMAAYDLGANARSRSIDAKDSLISGIRKELEDLQRHTERVMKSREEEFERQGTLIAKLESANRAKDEAEAEVDVARKKFAQLQTLLGANDWEAITDTVNRFKEQAQLGLIVLAMGDGHGLHKNGDSYAGTLYGDVKFTSRDPAIALLNAGVQAK